MQQQQMDRSDVTFFGIGKVYRDRSNGHFLLDTDSVRRGDVESAEVLGNENFGGVDLFRRGDPDFGAFDLFERGGGDFGADDDDDDVFSGADDDEDEDPDMGRRGKRGKGAGKLVAKLRKNALRKAARESVIEWGTTVLSGVSSTVSTSQTVTIRIRLQHEFRAKDITFNGTTASSTITSIRFGDETIWTVDDGVDVSNFANTSYLRDLILGMEVRAGLDIVITGTCAVTGSPASGQMRVMITGSKPRVRP